MFNLLKILMWCVLPKVNYIFNVGDIPSGTWRGEVITHAALASDGGSARYGVGTDAQRYRMPQAGIILGADYEPWGANEVSGVLTDSYRRWSLVNFEADGAGTVVIGSINLNSAGGTQLSNVTRAFTMQTAGTSAQTASEGQIIGFQQITVGGDHSVGTVNQAGGLHIHWKPL